MDSNRRDMPWVAKLLVGLLVAVVLFFAPLLLEILEQSTAGTRYVAEFYERLGVDEILQSVYTAVFDVFN